MKKLFIILFIYTFCAGCNKKDDATPEIQKSVNDFAYRKSTPVTVSGQELSITVLEVLESRCPKDVVCIQAGSVLILFSVTDGVEKMDVAMTFKNDGKPAETRNLEFKNQRYSVMIKDVLPYPVSTEQPELEDYKVSLAIEKL